MTFFIHRHIRCTRIPCRCLWCYQTIEAGQPCDVHLTKWGEDDFSEDRYHPECWAAFDTLPVEEQESWSPGDFLRGCKCEAGTQCKCKKREPQQ